MILSFLLSVFVSLFFLLLVLYLYARYFPRQPPHHDERLSRQPDYLTRDYWRDRGRQDPLSNGQWSECEQKQGFPIPNKGPAETVDEGFVIASPVKGRNLTDPTPDEPWITTPPEKGAMVLVNQSGEGIIYASLSITGAYLYESDGTQHLWAYAIGWKPVPVWKES